MARGRSRRTRTGWLGAAGLVLAVGVGCGTHEPLGPQQVRHDTTTPRHSDCVGRVDALIDSLTIPRSDRDYAIGMCEAHR